MRARFADREVDFCSDAVANSVIGIIDLQLDPVGPGLRVGDRCDEANDPGMGAAVDQGYRRRCALLQTADLAFRDAADGQYWIEIDHRCGDIADFDKIAKLDVAGADNTGERCAQVRIVDFNLHPFDDGKRGVEARRRAGPLGARSKTLLVQLFRGIVLDLALLQYRHGFDQLGAAVVQVQLGDDLVLLDGVAAPGQQLGDLAFGFGAQVDAPRRFGAAGERNEFHARARHQIGHPNGHAWRDRLSGARQCGLLGAVGAVADLAGSDPAGGEQGDGRGNER
jgi:hypothetical protein